MGNRYWVGGTGSWLDGARWSLSSGGPGGWPPSSTDQIIFDSLSSSGSYTVSNMPTSLACDGLFIANPAVGTVNFATFSTTITTSGSYIISSGVTVPSGRNLTITVPGSAGSASIRTNGISLGSVVFTGADNGADAQQLDALTATTFVLNRGTWDTQGFDLTTTGNLVVQPPPTYYTAMLWNASNVTVGGTADFSSILGTFTLNAGTSTLYLNSNNVNTYTLRASGQTFSTVWKSGSSGKFSGAFTAATVFLRNGNFIFDGPLTVTVQSLTITSQGGAGNPFNGRSTVRSSSATDNVTFSVSSSAALVASNLQGVTYSGVAPGSYSSLGDLGGNVGLSSYFDAPQNVYWVPTSSPQYANQAYWASTSGGSIVSTLYPLPQHTMVFDNNSAYSLYINSDVGSLNSSARSTSGLSIRPEANAAFYGNLTLSTAAPFITSAGYTFANKHVAQTVTTNGCQIGGVLSGAGGDVVCAKASQTLTFTGATNLGTGTVGSAFQVVTGNVVASALTAKAVYVDGGSLTATGAVRVEGTSTVWRLAAGATYAHNNTGYIWSPNTGTTTLLLGAGNYRKIALNQNSTFVLNVASNPYIGELTPVGDFPYAYPAGVTFTGAGTVTIFNWQMNGTSTAARIAVTGSSGAQIATDSYYPIQASNISLTTLPTSQVNQFYATGSLDNGGNTNWVFGTVPPRASGLLFFF